MNKMLVAIFDSEYAAYQGLTALKQLHQERDITLYATAVVVSDAMGSVSVKQQNEPGPLGTALGFLTGGLIGLVAGPSGVMVGASTGSLTGLVYDLARWGIEEDFVNEVATGLQPGKAAVLAEVEETWMTPVDVKLERLGGVVYRRLRLEFIEDELAQASAAFDAELKELKEAFAEARAESKAAVQAEIDKVKAKMTNLQAQITAKREQIRQEQEAKVEALRSQVKDANERQKAKTEKRIADLKAEYAARDAKLEQAQKLIKEAVSPHPIRETA
jgi:uncharacterized membrane protein